MLTTTTSYRYNNKLSNYFIKTGKHVLSIIIVTANQSNYLLRVPMRTSTIWNFIYNN